MDRGGGQVVNMSAFNSDDQVWISSELTIFKRASIGKKMPGFSY